MSHSVVPEWALYCLMCEQTCLSLFLCQTNAQAGKRYYSWQRVIIINSSLRRRFPNAYNHLPFMLRVKWEKTEVIAILLFCTQNMLHPCSVKGLCICESAVLLLLSTGQKITSFTTKDFKALFHQSDKSAQYASMSESTIVRQGCVSLGRNSAEVLWWIWFFLHLK